MSEVQTTTYESFLRDLKARIHSVQTRAALAVNRELVLLYWEIGRDILDRQQREGWGAKVIERLAQDLRREFPEMKGFSPRNLKYMRKFAEAWPDEQFVQQAAAQIPWFHNCTLLDKVAAPQEREWLIRKFTRLRRVNGSRLYHRQGKAVTNFQVTLPPV